MVSLDQAFAHCPIFLTAASRRSLDRVSVPVWLIILSNQLLIVALVSRYLTNKLIRRELLSRRINPFHYIWLQAYGALAVISNCCSPPRGKFSRVTHPSATKAWKASVQLACVRHTASVHPEPGSNSRKISWMFIFKWYVFKKRCL